MKKESVDLLRKTICANLSESDFRLFLHVCETTGLDPFTRQIYAVMRYDAVTGRDVMSIQVGIDGLRLIASRSGELDGHDGPYWAGTDGVWKDAWLPLTPPSACKISIYRKGTKYPFTGIARFDSYAQRKRDGQLANFWARMPDVMLAKVAEAMALRKAFPAEMSALYIDEEMTLNPELIEEAKPARNASTKQTLLMELVAKKGIDMNKLLNWAGVNSIEEMSEEKLDRAIEFASKKEGVTV